DGSESTITSYPSNRNGNIATMRRIAGSNTTMSNAFGIALNSKCTLFVGDDTVILEFPASGNGNIAPTGSISGSKTGLGAVIEGLTFDKSGKLWVANAQPT